jgi:hypothetical protein
MNKRLRAYYPDSSIEKGLLTNGKEYMTEDYLEYIGYYHKYTNGEVFSLYEYNEKNSVKLIPYDIAIINQNVKDVTFTKSTTYNPKNYTTPIIKTVTPTIEDFKNKSSWERYFIRKVNDKDWGIRELTKEQYDRTQSNNRGEIDSFLFNTISIKWKLIGDMYDKYDNNNVLIGGVYNTNERTIKQTTLNFIGLDKYLTDPLEFTIYSKWYEIFIKNKLY